MMRRPKGEGKGLSYNHTSPEHTRRTLVGASSIKHILRHLLLVLVTTALLGHTTVQASSVGHAEEEGMQSEQSLKDEIKNMHEPPKKQDAGITEGEYMRDLLAKSNPELVGVNNTKYLLHIYRKKEHADLDIARYSMKDMQYKLPKPKGIRSLRILDSSTEQDVASMKQRNRVFAKLLYSFRQLDFTSLVIENVKIGPDETELLELWSTRDSALKAKRLMFRNVTTQTVRVFFKRLWNISVGWLCIVDCDGISLDDTVTGGNRYDIGGLELTDVKLVPDSHQTFLGRVTHLKHLNIHRVQFTTMQMLKDLLSRLTDTLEIDWDGYKQIQKEANWTVYTSQISQIHLLDVEYADSIEDNHRDISPAFTSLTTLTLFVQHTQLLDASSIQTVVEYTKKYHRGIRNVVVRGRMDMEDVKRAISNNESELAQTLLAHTDTHFTFADSTGIEPGRKYILFIPLSVYNEATFIEELGSRLGAVGGMSNWDWSKQGVLVKECETCKKRQEGYVTQLADGRIICDHHIKNNIQQQKACISADRNVYLANTHHIWYPRLVIFLHPALDGRVYLAETRDLLKEAIGHREDLMEIQYKAKGRKRAAVSTHPMQGPAINTGMASPGAIWQQQSPLPGGNSTYISSTDTGNRAAGSNYAPPQPPAAKKSRYEPLVSDRNIFAQPVGYGTQEAEQPQVTDISRGPRLAPEQELQAYLRANPADPEEELVWTQL